MKKVQWTFDSEAENKSELPHDGFRHTLYSFILHFIFIEKVRCHQMKPSKGWLRSKSCC